MNKNYVLLAALFTAAAVLYSIQPPATTPQASEYLSYLRKFNKAIPKSEELLYRTKIFNNFLEVMNKHNADKTQTWKMGINQFSDLT
jgi:hypothetical protein